ncbi:MAG: prepilin-type N-terminal cleavage/methylation domain-containing protein [Phycisphaerae bacterium]|nr:prepilin-type N-terminal cleavage/methylation domain-containing protein [Phycisphaerae bacterium]NIR66774.1 prepilin-type N-terminal cleavage/methylation domain-containing protein [candidate division Zixibacteria bacterium]NIP52643.1 prepilin-type N-terminal cleavage/methylation domain-containing protein [Phycisphaerae bacterium]NIS49848.1 prepilin-type N-terminal cleavage/methylation domain-containing protein [Phycisphaerae bacterium]NIU07941.1 prepilin-type N-terminal cleavage/methylation 
MAVKREKTGFTLVELLTVLAIIALLVGLLIPSVTVIRNTAKGAKQKAQLNEIGLALTAFRNDYGDYPPSDWLSPDYCGAQKLAEALLGRDLLGFHPKSDWSATNLTFYPVPPPPQNLEERRGPYLEQATDNAFKLGDLYTGPTGTGPLAPDTYVICDSFGVKKIKLASGKTVNAGTPILYYRANTASKGLVPPPPLPFNQRIYNVRDNVPLTSILMSIVDGTAHRLGLPAGNYQNFYGNPAATPPVIGYIQDPKVTARPWPYRPDSYLLISAGADGLYGTRDDICNFGN